jgi:hypothetical protein
MVRLVYIIEDVVLINLHVFNALSQPAIAALGSKVPRWVIITEDNFAAPREAHCGDCCRISPARNAPA